MSSGAGFFGSPIYKKVMSKVYGIGAAVAIVGALFKIMHFPGASIMLTAGLGVEALIFFLSAFEPPHEMPDWSLVYPELAGLETHREMASATPITASSSLDISALNQGTKIEPEAMAKLGDGINNLSHTVEQLSDLGDISAVTSAYLASLRTASGSVASLSEVQTQTVQNIRQSSEALSESYVTAAKAVANGGMKAAEVLAKTGDSLIESVQTSGKQLNDVYKTMGQTMTSQVEKISANALTLSESYVTAAKSVSDGGLKVAEVLAKTGNNLVESVQSSGKQLTDAYKTIGQAMTSQIEQISTSASKYAENIQGVNKNLSSINSVYELHLSSINTQVNEVNKLSQTLNELNTIYGNMLSVMNTGK
ncbi:MAG: gliding motility protein GldL [Cytophagaceae bacterium]|jgi:vacuolar-type H+-ATPase subunit I/STV1|nr:gliding motility protein GldL [Cytophagaceae bacterium]